MKDITISCDGVKYYLYDDDSNEIARCPSKAIAEEIKEALTSYEALKKAEKIK